MLSFLLVKLANSNQPNIIFISTDDQDINIGGDVSICNYYHAAFNKSKIG